MSKKLVAFAIVFTLLLGIMAPFVSAFTIADDVAGTKYEEAAYLLGALNIMVGDKDTGNFRPEDGILRSEFAKVSVAMAGLTEVALNSQKPTRFPDVVENHWATGYINVADTQNYIIGDDTGSFRPDDKITFAEAVTIIIRLLGYEPAAKENGGYPTGYLVTAAQNGLLNGINQAPNEEASRGVVAQLAYNALTINMMKRVGFGQNETYQIVDETLLEDYLNVVRDFGQVTANTESSFTGESTLRDDEVQITTRDGESNIYKVGTTNARNYLGYNVVFYSKEVRNTQDKILVLVRPDKAQMNELTITSDNLHDVTGNADSKKTVYYWINKETDRTARKAIVSSTAIVFYNGVASTLEEHAVENLMALMTNGHIKLLDTNKDDEYDMVLITKYTNYVVDDVSLTSYRISDKGINPSLILDPTDRNIKFTITKNGETIALKDIKEYDVLSVTMSGQTPETSRVINVTVTDETVAGKITEIFDEKYTITQNDGTKKVFKLAENMADEFNLKLQDEGTFYLNAEGKIAWFNNMSTISDNYAFLVTGAMSNEIDETLRLKLFTLNGEPIILEGAEKIKLNREGSFTGPELLAELEQTADENFSAISNIAQLIVYDVNSSGKVISINTAVNNTANKSELRDKFSKDVEESDLIYKSASKQLDRYNISNNTIIFDIPKTSVGTDTEDFAVRSINMFVDKNKYDVSIYDLTADLTARALIVMNSDGDTNAESPIAVVKEISDTKNDEDIEVHKLYALMDGKEVEVYAKDKVTLYHEDGTLLQKGDIIQYRLNSKGEIDKITVLFKADDKADESKFVTTVDTQNEIELVYGIVDRKFSTSINVKNQNGIANYATNNAIVYNYDASKPSNQVTIADASQIQRYDDTDPRAVFIRIYKNQVQEIVIVKLPAPIDFE